MSFRNIPVSKIIKEPKNSSVGKRQTSWNVWKTHPYHWRWHKQQISLRKKEVKVKGQSGHTKENSNKTNLQTF